MTTTLRSAIPVPLLTVPNDPPSTSTSVDHHSSDTSHSNTVTLAVVVGVLSAISSLAFLLLLYTTSRWRRRSTSNSSANQPQPGVTEIAAADNRPVAGRGLDPAIVEHLPLFSFKSLKGNTGGLECAVCLSQYEESDILRLLPSCQHAFHVHCIDKWLVAQSASCPLCRNEISSKDSLILVDSLTATRRSFEDQNSALLELSTGSIPRRSLQIHSVRASTDMPHVEIVPSPPRTSQLDESAKSCGNGAGGGISDQNGAARSDTPNNAPTAAADRVSSSRNRRLAHRIVISDILLQQRWSDVIAPADVLYLSSYTLFTSDPVNTGGSNIRLSFSSDGKPRWSTSSATRPSTASANNNESRGQTSAQKQQQDDDPKGGRASCSRRIEGHSLISDPLASETLSSNVPTQDAEASESEGEHFCRSTVFRGEKFCLKSRSEISLQRSVSETTGLDRISGSISQCGMSEELFSSGRHLIGHPAVAGGHGDEEKIIKWLRIAGGTLKRLILKDSNTSNRIRVENQTQRV